MRLLFLILGLFLLFSCSKNNDEVAPTKQDKHYITEITSIQTSNFTADTTTESLPPLNGSIATSKSEVFFNDLFNNLLENLSISLNKKDSLSYDLQFKEALFISHLTLKQDGHVLVFAPKDSIRISSYDIKQSFNFDRDHTTYSYESSEPVHYSLERFYKRISFTADIKLKVKDDQGYIVTLTGRIKGSKVGNTSTAMHFFE